MQRSYKRKQARRGGIGASRVWAGEGKRAIDAAPANYNESTLSTGLFTSHSRERLARLVRRNAIFAV